MQRFNYLGNGGEGFSGQKLAVETQWHRENRVGMSKAGGGQGRTGHSTAQHGVGKDQRGQGAGLDILLRRSPSRLTRSAVDTLVSFVGDVGSQENRSWV